jgi:hypothetical protein
MRRSDLASTAIISIAAFLSALAPSLAGFVTPPVGAPGPIAGVGLPALAILGGATWLARRMRTRKQSR